MRSTHPFVKALRSHAWISGSSPTFHSDSPYNPRKTFVHCEDNTKPSKSESNFALNKLSCVIVPAVKSPKDLMESSLAKVMTLSKLRLTSPHSLYRMGKVHPFCV